MSRNGRRVWAVVLARAVWSGRGRVLSGAVATLAVVAASLGAASGVAAADDGTNGAFSDDDGSVHELALDALAAEGVLAGIECGEALICPGKPLKRWEMAVWLVRVLDGTDPNPVDASRFVDVDAEHWWAPFVDRLFALEVTVGCRTEPARFCPERNVTRAQMATFLKRAFDLEPAPSAGFTDVDVDGTHSANIDALAAAGITVGCRRDPLRYCPARDVNRAQMATFLARALGLVELPGPSRGADSAACRLRGIAGSTTAGFPLYPWVSPATGTLRVAVLFVDFPDAAAAHSTDRESELGLPYVKSYLEAASYGRLNVEFVPRHGWLRAQHDSDHYLGALQTGASEVDPIEAEAVRLADPDFDFTGIDILMVVMPSTHFNSGGEALGQTGTAEGVISATVRVNTTQVDTGSIIVPSGAASWGETGAHEVAHSLGLLDMYPYDHRRHELPDTPAGKNWIKAEFGLMGLTSYFPGSLLDFSVHQPSGVHTTAHSSESFALEMLAWSRWQLGWLDASQVRCVIDNDATVALGPVGADPAAETAMAAVPLSAREAIVIESRRTSGYDTGLDFQWPDGGRGTFPGLVTEGVLVYTVDAALDSGDLPITVAGDTGNGQVDHYPILTVGQSVTVRGYTITVVADDGDTHTVTVVADDEQIGTVSITRPGPEDCRPYGSADSVTAGFPLRPWVSPATGTLRVAVLFVDFPDAAAAHSTDRESDLGLPYVKRYLEAASYGRLDVEFVPRHGWLRAQHDSHHYLGATSVDPIEREAVRLADPDFDFTGIDILMVVMPSTHFGAASVVGQTSTAEGVVSAAVRVNTSQVDTSQIVGPIGPASWGNRGAHEVAHSLGLLDMYPYDHSRHELPDTPAGKNWIKAEFGLMGLTSYFPGSLLDFSVHRPDGTAYSTHSSESFALEMLAWSRWQLGWLEASQVRCVTDNDATVALGPVGADPAAGTAMAAVPLSAREAIVIESRRTSGYDTGLDFQWPDGSRGTFPGLATEGVLVYTVDAALDSGDLPITVAGDTGNGQVDHYPILTVGQSVTVRGYTITVVADDGNTHTVTIAKASEG